MQLERLNHKELIKKSKEIFYDYMASSEDFYNGDEGKFEPCTAEFPTVIDKLYEETLNTLKEDEERTKMYEAAIEENEGHKECVKALKKQLDFLRQEKEILLTSNMEQQKKLYKKTKSVDYSRNVVRIPLDKRINSFYDDLTLEVLFYDDVAVLNGKYEEYKLLKTFEERKAFFQANTEITHLGIAYIRGNKHIATMALLGKVNFQDIRVKEGQLTLLDERFSDFENLTLADTNEIKNNDLKQFIQSKIDLDKEDCMEKLADKFVGNDNYQILRDTSAPDDSEDFSALSWNSNSTGNLYIRYICPSTQRVYFNHINKRNLALSEYYKEDDYESYIDAWWSINNMGADPYNNKPMIRC